MILSRLLRNNVIVLRVLNLSKSFSLYIAFFHFRRCFGESYYFLAESPSSLACTTVSASGSASNGPPDVANHGMTTIVNHPGVPIHLFTRHVLERHSNDNEGFVRAFEHIESLAAVRTSPSRSSPTAAKENLASLLPHNVDKNRYKNVLACEFFF